jgi:hypothetical protein
MLDPVEYVGQRKSSRPAPPGLAVARMEVEIEERDSLGPGTVLLLVRPASHLPSVDRNSGLVNLSGDFSPAARA